MSEDHRADAIFTLPAIPATASVASDLPGWRDGLAARGVQLVDRSPDLSVVGAFGRGDASTMIIDGANPRSLGASRYEVTGLISLPPSGSPLYLFSSVHPRALAYALRNVIQSPPGLRGLRNRTIASLAGAGLRPPAHASLVLAVRRPGPPALIANAAELGARGDSGWFLTVAPGAITRRCTFVLFAPGSSRPLHALKFARVPGEHTQFERDETGLKLAAAAGGPVAEHAPRWIGRCDVGERAASLESAAAGTTLTRIIESASARDRKVDAARLGAHWLLDVARHTMSPPGSLTGEVERLVGQVLPAWAGRIDDLALTDAVASLPGVFNHGDVYEDHVIVDRDRLTVIDWEYASSASFPLWDLAFYATNVLSAVDGNGNRQQLDLFMAELFSGSAASSKLFFTWVREHVTELGLPADWVGRVMTLYWLHRSDLSRRERERAERAQGGRIEPSWLERTAEVWLSHAALGPRWNSWRNGHR